MITRVRMKNWKSHRDTDISFGDGTNVLIGSMGSGKSSVLEAITYALFGTLPGVQSRRIKLEDLITSRPRPLDRAEVEVSFIAPDGVEYTVKRVLERGKGTVASELRRGTEEIIESSSSGRVNDLIKKLLGLDYDLFERAIYSEQNRLDYFLTLPRGKRMESIDELLGINKLEKARKSIGTISNRVRDRADDKEAEAKQLKQDPSLGHLPTYEMEVRKLESDQKEISKIIDSLSPEIDSLRAQVAEFRRLEQELARMEQTYRGLAGSADELKRQLDELERRLGSNAGLQVSELQNRVEASEREYRDKNSRWSKLNSDLTAGLSNLRGLETRQKMLRDELEKIDAELNRKRRTREELERLSSERVSDSIDRIQAEIRDVSDQLAASRSKIQDLKQSLDGLSGAGSVCPVCESPLSEEKKQELLRRREGELEDLVRGVSELEPRLRELNDELREKQEAQRRELIMRKEVEEIPRLEEERSKISKHLDDLSSETEKVRRECEGLRMETERARMELDALQGKLSSLRQVFQLRVDLDGKRREYSQKLLECESVRQAMEKLRRSYDEKKVEEARRRLEELIGTRERLNAELSGKGQLLAEKRKLVESIREKLALISRYEAEARHLRESAQALATIQTAFFRTQLSMRRMFVDGVNEVMNDIWSGVYPYGDYVGIQLSVEGNERSGDYVLKLRDRSGNWVPVEGIASGGERTDACLTLRIAFSIVLAPNLKWIVFDEPTHNLDSTGIQELAKVLRDRLPEVVQQILIITHEERLESAVSGYLYRFSRNKDADEPTRVEQVTAPEVFE
ncbi:MAG TPA: SMC family ATPase [Hadesarchaea archaeon]|nr:SMC family ATPase [Hadesarchaea archaeon]